MQALLRPVAAATLVLALSGCASSYRVQATVQSFSSLPALPADPTYRLDRLPSQAATAEQARLEALADPALFRAGLRRDDARPRYAVQVAGRTQSAVSSSALGMGPGFGWGGFGWGGWGGPPIPTAANTYYQRHVDVVVRDLASNRVVYESQADNDSFYLDGDEVLGALFDAALAGFPQGSQGPRLVDVPVRQLQPNAAR